MRQVAKLSSTSTPPTYYLEFLELGPIFLRGQNMLLKQNARPVDDNPPNVARPSIPPPTAHAASVF